MTSSRRVSGPTIVLSAVIGCGAPVGSPEGPVSTGTNSATAPGETGGGATAPSSESASPDATTGDDGTGEGGSSSVASSSSGPIDVPEGPGIEGEIADGSVVVILALDGESFGEVGPPVDQVFDRFSDKAATDPRDPGTPVLGHWNEYGYAGTAPAHQDYVDAESLSGTASYQGFTQVNEGASLRTNRLVAVAEAPVREVFVSANFMVPQGGFGPPGPYVGADGWPVNSFAKLFWMEDGPSGGSVDGAWDMLAYGLNDTTMGVPDSGNEGILNSRGSEEFPAWPTQRSRDIRDFWSFEHWHLLQYGFTAPAGTYDPTPAAFRRASQQDSRTVYAELDTSGTYQPFASGVTEHFDRVATPGYIRTQDPNVPSGSRRQIYIDDIYIALGPGAMCRVELHDTEADADASVVALSPVMHGDWSADAITVTLRFNRYVPVVPGGWWLKVFGADGRRITARLVGAP